MAIQFIEIQRATFIDSIESALISKYGAGITIHYKDANNIIFSCPGVLDKVIRIFRNYVIYSAGSKEIDKLMCYYGDAWTSGTTITNAKQFSGDALSDGYYYGMSLITTADLVLGDDFIYISINSPVPQMAIMGKLTNGKFITIGFTSRTVVSGANPPAPNVNSHGYMTDGTVGEVELVVMSNVCNDNGKFVIMPLLFTLAGALILNADGTYATITGMYNAARKARAFALTFYCSGNNYYSATSNLQLTTSIFFLIG
jgi:hypothetical protein